MVVKMFWLFKKRINFSQDNSITNEIQTSQLSLFHSETQGFWSILKVIPSNLTVKNGIFDSKR